MSEEVLHLRLDEGQLRILKPVDVVEHHIDHHIAPRSLGQGCDIPHSGTFPPLRIHEQKRRVGSDQLLDRRDMRAELSGKRMDLYPALHSRKQALQFRKGRRILLHEDGMHIDTKTFPPPRGGCGV
jgi:hypothetical protein